MDLIGTTISHYKVRERLGGGGMGDVYLAEDVRLGRPVALKLLRQRHGCADEERARLLREARAASALNHPGIATIYDVGEADTEGGRVFLLAMEYVPGATLADAAAASSLSLDEVLDVIGQAADALADAHARGIVHRDIKPSNLMLSQGRLKILDFGLARMRPPSAVQEEAATSGASTITFPGAFAGTPHYMSPEQALGGEIDARSDLFSLGVVFYELLAGKRPFEGDGFVQVSDAVLHRDPPRLPARWSDPRWPAIEGLAMRMLAKDAAARPSDLREVATEIQRLKAGIPTLPAERRLAVAVAGFANITGDAEDEWLGTGLAETITAALQEIEGLEIWGPERLRESLGRMKIEAGGLRAEDAVELGRATGARWVLAGAFQRSGERVRVTARVVEVESGLVARAVVKDGSLEAIFELQDRIVRELAAALRATVAEAHEGEETKIVGAYEALSRGLLNMRALSYESLDRAVLLFERALALDPNYVRAQVELGTAYAQKADYLTAPELHERAAALLRRVLEARPRLARAWRELGLALVALGRTDEGLDALHRALSLAPQDPYVLGGVARGLFIGRADFGRAAGFFEKAVERNPQAGWYWMQLAHCQALRREFESGEAAARRAIELQEAFLSGQQGVQLVGAFMRLGHLFALQGRHLEARDAFEREIAFSERLDHALRSRIRIELHMRLGAAHRAVGERARAEAAFEIGLDAFSKRLALGADDPFTRYYAAGTHALRGEKDEALAWLARSAADIPDFAAARARVEPEWDGLRDDRRFERIVGPRPPA